MEKLTVLPGKPLTDAGAISKKFLDLNIVSFHQACAFVRQLPYGYNSDRDDPIILFTAFFSMKHTGSI